MAMFAVPELAGGSSIPARMAATAPKAAPVVAKAAPKIAEDVAAADRLGIPVMRSDVKPHQQPWEGGASASAKASRWPEQQVCGRTIQGPRGVVADFVQEYVGDTILPAISTT